jgi:PAS domain S-box-containing protein
MPDDQDKDLQLRSVALQNAQSILAARERAERELTAAKEALEIKTDELAVSLALLQGTQRFCDILGYTREELLQLQFQSLTCADDLPATKTNVKRLSAGEIGDYVIEKRYVRKDGSLVWGLATVTLFKDALGQPLQFLGVLKTLP